MKPAQRKIPQRYETDLPLGDFMGVNTFGPHSAILPNELRELSNYDIYPGYLKSRRGSYNYQLLFQKIGARDVLNGVMFNVTYLGDNYETVMLQLRNGSTTGFFWANALPTVGAFQQVTNISGVAVDTLTAETADMKVSGNKVFIFHPSQNYIIESVSGTYRIRTMGLPKICLTSLAPTGSSALTGKYTVGVELVYQVDGVDYVAGSPNRKTSSLKLLDITVTNQNILVQLDSATFPAALSPGDYWTHVRVWRSLNQNVNISDPLNPVDAQGLPDELYPEQLIDKAAIILAGYQVTLTKLDSELPSDTTSEYPVLDFSRIELTPLPPSFTGAYHKNRIWVSRSQGLDDVTQSAVYYSNSAGDAYAEQYSPFNALKSERGDGQQVIKLLTFESDLIVLKQAKTLRVPNGDVDVGLESLDANIGISHLKLAAFVPKVGICAITNDQGDFRILGYDLKWTNIFNGYDISRPMRPITAAMAAAPTFVSFAYINGKLLISDGAANVYPFNAKEGKGWGVYTYPMVESQLLLTFDNGSQCLVASKNTYLIAIEADGLDTDINNTTDQDSPIALSFTLPRYQVRGGRDILEMLYLSVNAELSNNLQGIPYANGYPWPLKTVDTITPFVPDVGVYGTGDLELEREYRLYIEARQLAQFIHFRMTTYAPATIRDIALHCFVDEIGMGNGFFDPFIAISSAQVVPDWLDVTVLDSGLGARDTSLMDTYDAVDGVRDPASMDVLDGDR